MKKHNKTYINSTISNNNIAKAPDNDSSLHSEVEILKSLISDKLGISKDSIDRIIKKEKDKQILLPISIFNNKLSTLEIVVAYLKEHHGLRYSKIAQLLNRNHRTIWHAYHRYKDKKIKLKVIDSKVIIPITIFSDRKFSMLESLVVYLRDNYNLRFTKIGEYLMLNVKTVWTAYNRASKKVKNG